MEIQASEFPVRNMIDSSLVLFQERAFKHSLVLTSEIEEGLESLIADERKIKQVLFNLLSNATKFTPEGGSIHVSAAFTGDKEFARISVKDTGIGISPENLGKLFQPFMQLDSSYTKKYEGTGLGLSLCKKIIELHGGSIWAESEVGKGSIFTFTVPNKREVAGEHAQIHYDCFET